MAVGLAGAVLLAWSSVVLGRFMIHEAAVRDDHALVRAGPYRFVRHPVYAGYLALLFGSGVASLNVCLWLLRPVSLIGILIQAASEEQLLIHDPADAVCFFELPLSKVRTRCRIVWK